MATTLFFIYLQQNNKTLILPTNLLVGSNYNSVKDDINKKYAPKL
jgi:hypothetical protein